LGEHAHTDSETTKKKHFPSLAELTKKPVDGFSAGLVGDSLFEWAITVMGPPDTF
jgi:ubiquitin-conjugating enzyme E2 G1